jgi:hypothetical protein
LFLTLLLAVAAGPAAAQEKLTAATIAATVKETNRLIKQNYVFPDKADAVTAKLSGSLASGRYEVSDAAELSARLTEDMQAATQDKHMSVKFDPAQAAALIAGPSAAGASGPDSAYFASLMRKTNYGVAELKILPGNVRYVNLGPIWLWDPKNSPRVLDEAMRFLSDGDAYIMDIRTNGGGDMMPVAYVTSYLMGPDQKLMDYRLTGEAPSESRTVKVPGSRLGKPLYVLTSAGSASASEEFAAHVKNFKLGKLVGATTAGAGNRNALYGTREGFVVSVSVGTALHPVTKASWEGAGFAPDIPVPPPAAVDAAHLDALKTLRGKAPAPEQASLDWTIQGLQAKVSPVKLPKELLTAYAGSYGSRTVTERDGRLYWHLGPQQWELVPLTQDLFMIASGPNIRIKFDRNDDKVTGVTEHFQSGKTVPFPRSTS